MPDRSFDPPTGDDDDDFWLTRRDLLAQLRATPNASRELQRFATVLAQIVDAADIQAAFQWLEQQRGSTGS